MRTVRGVRRGTGAVLTCGITAVLALQTGAASPASGGELATFYGQKLDWKQCEETEPLPPEEQPDEGVIVDPWQGQWKFMECATAMVPIDYTKPEGGQLHVEVSRIKAKDPDHRQGVLLFNPGGPGGSGLSMPLGAREMKVAESFDLIGFDPRGVGRSTRLHCERIEDTRPRTSRPSDDQLSAYADYARAHEDACQRGGKDLRPHISTANTARDMDVIRAALGEKKINYLGYSYGTYLGAVYGSLFPGGLDRSVLDSSMHPDWLWREQALQQSVGVRFNVEQWAGWVGARDRTYHLGTSRQDVLATVEALATDLANRSVPLDRERPEDWPLYWPKEFDRTTLDSFLAQATQPRPVWDVTAEVIGELREAADKKTALSPDAADAAAALAADRDITKVDPGVYDTVSCEADWPTDLDTYYADMRRYREKYPFRDGNGSGVIGAAPTNCTFRSFTPPEKPVGLERKGYPTGLVIQGDGDPATQYEGGPAMAKALDHRLISVRDSGTHGHYGLTECVTARVDDYLVNGTLPPPGTDCAAEPRPSVHADNAVAAKEEASSQSKRDRVDDAFAHHSIWQRPATT